MKARLCGVLATLFLVLFGGIVAAQEPKLIVLPAPETHGGKPLMEALALRSTSRIFASEFFAHADSFQLALGCVGDQST